MKYASIILCHYAQADDFGETRARRCGFTRSQMLRMTLETLTVNTDYPAEIIVIDNGGSPDDTDYLVQKTREGLINTLVRNRENTHFAYAWNQGLRLATGDYLCFTCNDISFNPGWLSATIHGLEAHEGKLLASPYITPDKNKPRFNKFLFDDGCRANSMAGSNCVVMTRDTLKDIGEWPHHRIGGSIWYRVMVSKGYMVVVPPENMVEHLAFRGGVDYKKSITVEKTLLQGDKIDFHYTCPPKKVFHGKQLPAGIPLYRVSTKAPADE